MSHPRTLYIYFRSYQTNSTNFTKNYVKNVHSLSAIGFWTHDLWTLDQGLFFFTENILSWTLKATTVSNLLLILLRTFGKSIIVQDFEWRNDNNGLHISDFLSKLTDDHHRILGNKKLKNWKVKPSDEVTNNGSQFHLPPALFGHAGNNGDFLRHFGQLRTQFFENFWNFFRTLLWLHHPKNSFSIKKVIDSHGNVYNWKNNNEIIDIGATS